MVATLPKKDRQAPPFRAPKGGVKKNRVKCKRTARGTAPSAVVDAPIGAAIVKWQAVVNLKLFDVQAHVEIQGTPQPETPNPELSWHC